MTRHPPAEEAACDANVVSLVEAHAPAGVVLDLGRGIGAVAGAAISASGRTYVGVVGGDAAQRDREARGLETHRMELQAGDAFASGLRRILAGRPLAALLLVDTLQHLADAGAVLDQLRDLAGEHAGAIVVTSVPNVTHLDVAVKLLQGRWDPTGIGLVDEGRGGLYGEDRLLAVAGRTGWRALAGADVELARSDQHFPGDDVALLEGTPLHGLLHAVRTQCAPNGLVVRFVRAWEPSEHRPAPPPPALPQHRAAPPPPTLPPPAAPFLTVLTRTLGNRPETLEDTLLCLAAQTCSDFEVLLLVHGAGDEQAARVHEQVAALPPDVAARFRVLPVHGGGRCRPLNVGVEAARGRYVAFVDDDDLVTGDWVEVFGELAERGPGSVLRTGVAAQDVAAASWPGRDGFWPVSGITTPFPGEFDLLDHMFENRSPLCGLAFPRSCFRDLGIRFDESLPVLEDWDVLLQAGTWCGLTNGAAVTSLYRRWVQGGSRTDHDGGDWAAARAAVQAKVDRRPLLFPTGTASRVQELYDRAAELEHRFNTTSFELRQRDKELADLDRYRKELEAELEAHRRFQNDLRRSVAEAEACARRREADAARARAEAERAAAEAQRAAAEAQRAERRRLDELHVQRQEFVSSASWRLTWPVRELGGLARRTAARRGTVGRGRGAGGE
ncbi:MAG: glycosyltransferase family 2 protein [Acidimicrobiales bacterium]